jgi:hypothetical protein
MYARGQQMRCVGMPEIVEADAPQAPSTKQSHPFVRHAVRLERATVSLCDDERVAIGSDASRSSSWACRTRHAFNSSRIVVASASVRARPLLDQKWLLCRSAFDIVVERSAKFASIRGRRLRVFYERADPATDERIESYFKNIRASGMGFDVENSAKYRPLTAAKFSHVLIGIEGKAKENSYLQIADSYIYAIARGSYDPSFGIYKLLMERGKLVTSQVEGALAPFLGIKNYCFELVRARR